MVAWISWHATVVSLLVGEAEQERSTSAQFFYFLFTNTLTTADKQISCPAEPASLPTVVTEPDKF